MRGEGWEGEANHATVQKKAEGRAELVNNKNKRLHHHSADNMTAEYALHVSHGAVLGCSFLMGIHTHAAQEWMNLSDMT